MKVTALLPEDLIEEVKALTKGKNITESIMLALTDWVSLQRIRKKNKKILESPLNFELSASELRKLSRNR